MTLYRRIAQALLVVFVAVYLFGALLFIEQARHDVARELQAVAVLAEELGAPETLAKPVVAGMRHLRPMAGQDDGGDDAAPAWFAGLIAPATAEKAVNGWRIDPGDEVEEIWEGFLLTSFSYTVGMVLCFIALFLIMRRGLQPLVDLSQGLAAVAGGSLAARLPRQSLRELDILVVHFNDMAMALEQEQATVSRLMTELLQLQDRERAHIARVLHDDLGQYLTGIRAQARSWTYAADLSDEQRRQAAELAEHCETLQRHFRSLLQDLHPLVMESLGLGGSISHLAEQWQQLSGLQCRLLVDQQLPELSGEQQTHLYRFLQEALNNVSRHADASYAVLAVSADHHGLKVEVRDDGAGLDNLPQRAGLGLLSMRERARCLGGRVQFLSRVGEGTSIRLAIPLSHQDLSAGVRV